MGFWKGSHSQVFTRNHQFQAIHGDICVTTLNFGHKSMKEWNLCQIESILHSMESVWEMESTPGHSGHNEPTW